MKKYKIILVVLFLLILNVNHIKADECNKEFIDNAKKNVTASLYQTYDDEYGFYNVISIGYVDENMYFSVYDDFNKTTKKYTFEDNKDGIIKIDSWYIFKEINYTIKFYYESEGCKNELVNTFKIKTPKYNELSELEVCNNSDYELCERFADTSEYEPEEFIEKVEEYEENKNKTAYDRFLEFMKKNYIFIILPIVLISLYFTIRIIILKRSRKV